MDIKKLSKELGQDMVKTRYWRDLLKKEELIEPKKSGNKDLYTESDVNTFLLLKKNLEEGAETVTDAIDFIKRDISPKQALERHEALTNQLQAAQKKVLDLRRDPWWVSIASWIKNRWNKLLGRT